MDPFTLVLRGIIGKKMVDSAKQAYSDTRASVDKLFSDWDASLKADYAKKNADGNTGKKNTTRANADAVARIFEQNGTLNTDPLASKSNNATATEAEPANAEPANAEPANAEPANTQPAEDDTDVITYTYKPGDTFGQVLLNLGLSDGSHLWGQGGDVEYYTQQLRDQDMLDARGNVKLGIPFKLRRRR